tara:strand:+ start:1147 stop:1425 length:279 start_codon:yes stop_codon:yes gene_type:complete
MAATVLADLEDEELRRTQDLDEIELESRFFRVGREELSSFQPARGTKIEGGGGGLDLIVRKVNTSPLRSRRGNKTDVMMEVVYQKLKNFTDA